MYTHTNTYCHAGYTHQQKRCHFICQVLYGYVLCFHSRDCDPRLEEVLSEATVLLFFRMCGVRVSCVSYHVSVSVVDCLVVGDRFQEVVYRIRIVYRYILFSYILLL